MGDHPNDISLFETDGFSMWPFLKPSRRIIVKKVDPESLKLGDLVVYRDGGHMICHRFIRRIISAGAGTMYTQADAACLSQPAEISEEALAGKVIAVMNGKAVLSLEGPLRRCVNILIVLVSPILCAIFNAYRSLRRKR